MTVSEYVEANFTEEQKTVYNFLVNSFPENLRATVTDTDIIDNREVLSILALMAYVIGNAREEIFNLENIKDVSFLKESIEDTTSRFYEADKTAFLLNALDMGSLILDENASIEQNFQTLEDNKEHLLEAYKYIENRGTLNTLNKVIRDFLISHLPDPVQLDGKVLDVNNQGSADFTVNDISGGKIVRIEHTIEEMINPTAQYLDEDYYEIKSDSDLAKMISMVRPAGIIYTVTMLYKLELFENLTEPLVGAVHSDNIEMTIVSMDTPIGLPLITNPIAVSCGGPDAYSVYTVTIENPNPEAAIKVYLSDKPINDFVTNAGYFKQYASHHSFLIGPNESITVTVQTFYKYDYSTDFYVAGYFKKDSEETVYTTPLTITTTADPTPTLSKATITHEVDADRTGGYTTLTINNPNAVPVIAEIAYTYTSGVHQASSETTLAISGSQLANIKIYNLLNVTADGSFDVTLTASGYHDSAVENEISEDVLKNNLAL